MAVAGPRSSGEAGPTADPGLTSRSGGGPLVLQAEEEPVEPELEEPVRVVAHAGAG
jgi:hypothetical protein